MGALRKIGAGALGLAMLAPLLAVAAPDALAVRANPSQRFVHLHTYSTFRNGRSIDQAIASPAIGDVTGDGVADIVAGGMDGWLTVIDQASNAELRAVLVDANGMIEASPVLDDLNGDGTLDVVAATVNTEGRSYVRAYDMKNNAALIFSQTDSQASSISGFFGVTVGDVDGDGRKDIVATSLDQRLHVWTFGGGYLHGFPIYTFDTTLSAPALADVDFDGLPEIIFGGDMDAGQPFPQGGYLWIVNGDGVAMSGYPLFISTEVIWSSPAIGDLDLDGDLDVVVGTGRNFFTADSSKLYAFDVASRSPLAGWPRTLSGNTMPSPAIANLDDDPNLEVVTTTGDGRLHVLEHDGSTKWSQCIMNFSGCDRDVGLLASPVVANVDGDGEPEIVVSGERQLRIYDSRIGTVEANVPMLSESASRFVHVGAASPTVATIGGQTIIANHVTLNNNPDIRRGVGDQQAIYVWSVGATDGRAPWATFHRDMARRGAVALDTTPNPLLPKYVDAVYMKLLGRPADDSGKGYWSRRLGSGLPRIEFTKGIAVTPEWTGHVVDQLYQGVFGRPADSGGRAYWSKQLLAGARVADVAASLYGSREYFVGHGGTNPSYVDALYNGILQRSADAGGKAYWVDQLNRGTPREPLAKSLFLSFESNTRRVTQIYADLLSRAPDISGRNYWANQLTTLDDIVLAALLTASDEFYSKAVSS